MKSITKKFTNISKRINRLGIIYENQAGRKGKEKVSRREKEKEWREEEI